MKDIIKFKENGKVDSVELSRQTSEGLEQTHCAMINTDTDTYFVIKVDGSIYLAKAVDYEMIKLYKEN